MNDSYNKPPGPETTGIQQSILDDALRHHRAGQLKAAKADYRKILQTQPEHVTALHMLGVLEYQAGKHQNAIDLITMAGAHAPHDAGINVNLGNALQACGRLEEATAKFLKAIELNPGFALAYNNLGNALRLQGKHEQAVDALRQSLEIDNSYTDAHVNLAVAWQAMGNTEEAAQCYLRAIELDPNNGPARHMLAALRGDQTKKAPPEHVAHLFDEYAARFDQHLVETLGYSMPGLLRDEIDRIKGKNKHFQNVIDLGCGTGLAGIAFRPVARRLTGVDLSQGMIDKARERNVYDALYTGDIITVLTEREELYDLLICADVFPYIGDVQPLFSALRSHADAGALFAFSTESGTGSDYTLRPTGRYAHASDYLRKTATDHGFSVITMRRENLRKQQKEWIPGDLVVIQAC